VQEVVVSIQKQRVTMLEAQRREPEQWVQTKQMAVSKDRVPKERSVQYAGDLSLSNRLSAISTRD
jgi:hypothetical protein